MKQFLKFSIVLVIFITWTNDAFARHGFDWAIGNSKGTVRGKRCADYIWRDAAGNIVPNGQIMCCDWDANGDYVGGINCPFASPPADEDDITIGYMMNWYMDGNVKVALGLETGDVNLVDYKNDLSITLLSANNDMFGENQPTAIQLVHLRDDIYRIYYSHVNGDTLTVDTGDAYIDFSLEEEKDRLYEENLAAIVNVYPNPVSTTAPINFTNNLLCDCFEIKVKIYDYYLTTLFESFTLDQGGNPYSHSLSAGLYQVVIFKDEEVIGSTNLLVQ